MLCLHLLHSHLQSIFSEHHVLGLHLLRCCVGDLLEGEIQVVPYEGECAENDEEYYEREKLAVCCVRSRLKVGIGRVKDTSRLSEAEVGLTSVPKPYLR
jgi:hypothetical protein